MNHINLQQYYNTVKTLNEAASGSYSGKRWEDYETIKCPNGEVIDMTKLISEQAKARAALIHLEPIFAAFVNKLTTVYTFQISTQATDGVHYFVNPQFTNGLTFEEKVFLLAHECMHCVLNHMRRGANHDHMRSNIAADYEVNQTLVELGLFKSSTIKKLRGLIDEKYANWAYERIYDDNPPGSSQPNTPQQDKSKQSKDKNSQQGNSSGDGSNNTPKSNNSPSQNDGMDKDLSGTPAGDKMEQQSGSQSSSSGSSEGGQGRGEGDQGTVNGHDCSGQFGSTTPKTPGGFMGAKEGNKLAEAEGYPQGTTDDAIANSWKEAAVNAAKNVGAGKNAGSLVSKILDIWNTPTDWKKTFKKIVGKALNKQDKRMGYANKNVLVSRNMLLRTEKDKYDAMDYICIFTDSSGSISDNDLRYMLSEIYNIAYSFKPEKLVVGQFDTRITDIQMFNNPSEFKKYVNHATVKGRGGTDCQCIWDLLKKDKRFAKRPPELVIIMTDGYLTQYKRDSRTMNNLCWAILDNAGWDVAYRDQRTTCIHLDTKNIKK